MLEKPAITSGSPRWKLNEYFKRSGFTNPPILARMVSERHLGRGSTGIVNGPGQANIDIAFSKLRSSRQACELAKCPDCSRISLALSQRENQRKERRTHSISRGPSRADTGHCCP